MSGLQAVLPFLVACDLNRPPEPNYRQWSDEELRERKRHAELEVRALARDRRKREARAAAEQAPPPPSEDEGGEE